MEFTADSLRLDILELARTGNKLLSVAGRPEWMCQAVEVADPVTFTTPDTVLVIRFLCFVFFTQKRLHPRSLNQSLTLRHCINSTSGRHRIKLNRQPPRQVFSDLWQSSDEIGAALLFERRREEY